MANLEFFRTIAEEAFDEATQLYEASRTPKADGGSIIKHNEDPDRNSHKQYMIAMIFSAMFFEALLYREGTKRFGQDEYKKIDHDLYENRLRAFGITDDEVLRKCTRFREARKDLVHEKANEPNPAIRWSKDEAQHSIEFIRLVENLLIPPT